jgi:hypothetical protein
MRLNRQRAWLATETMLVCIGGTSLVAVMATMHWILIGAGAVVISGIWGVLYKLTGRVIHANEIS